MRRTEREKHVALSSVQIKTYHPLLSSVQVREENEALERSVAVAKGELDQMTTIFEAHARYLKVGQCHPF